MSQRAILTRGRAKHDRSPKRRFEPAGSLRAAGFAIGLAACAALPVLLGALAKPLAVVVAGDASLHDQASPQARPLSPLREGEVVPVLERSGDWLRIEDASGARGWARAADVRELQRR